jgi:hypothetical protein
VASAAVVRQRVKDYLYGSDYLKRPFTDFLNQDGNVSATDTVITVSNISSWGVGDIVEFNTGEQAYIKSVSLDNNRFTVARAWNGTTAATVTDLTAIEKNPRFTYAQLLMNYIQKFIFLIQEVVLQIKIVGITQQMIQDSKKSYLFIILVLGL